METFNRNFSHINLAQIGINIKYQITSFVLKQSRTHEGWETETGDGGLLTGGT